MSIAAPRGTVAASALGLTRRFGAATALEGVDIELRRGEIHALIGENGAGKSTLTKVLAGLDTPTSGEVRIDGDVVDHFDRHAAIARGVGLVQQHFTLVPTYTAEENIALSRPLRPLRPSRRALVARLTDLTERYGLPVRPRIPVSRLSVGERQRLEILRALDADAEILLLDEPTAVLVDAESDRLLALCRDLADEGRAIMIVTHRLGEVLQAADRVTVLRGGRVVLSTDDVAGRTRADLARAMVGEGSDAAHVTRRSRSTATGAELLTVRGLSVGRLTACSFEVRAGEIVGIAGVDGNGQAELESVLAGLLGSDSGSVDWHGREVRSGHPRHLRSAGVGYIPSDRHQRALAMPLSLADNLELGRGPVWRAPRRSRHRAAATRLGEWDVRGGAPATPAAYLSGGNAQKVVLAREMGGDPDLVLAAYPTRGLDPGAAAAIADRLVGAVSERSAAAVWFGAELDELLAVADRIVVLVSGRPSVEFSAPFDRHRIGEAMAGVLAVEAEGNSAASSLATPAPAPEREASPDVS